MSDQQSAKPSIKERLEQNVVWWSVGLSAAMLVTGFSAGYRFHVEIAKSQTSDQATKVYATPDVRMFMECSSSLDRLFLDVARAQDGPACVSAVAQHQANCKGLLEYLDGQYQ